MTAATCRGMATSVVSHATIRPVPPSPATYRKRMKVIEPRIDPNRLDEHHDQEKWQNRESCDEPTPP
jgi:hypothetical protein